MKKLLALTLLFIAYNQPAHALFGGVLCNDDNGCRDDEACVPQAGSMDKRCVKKETTPGNQAMVAGILCNDDSSCREGEACLPQASTNDNRCVKIHA